MPLIQISSISPSGIMYIFGLLFGALSVLYFAKDILLSLSITVKSYSLFVLSTLVFSASFLFINSALYILLIALSGISYSVAVLYTWSSNPLNRTYRFLLLIFSSLLFTGVASGVQSSIFSSNIVVVVSFVSLLFIIFLALSVVDTQEDSPVKSDVSIRDNIEVDSKVVVGSVVIENEGLFRRKYETPRVKLCYREDEQVYDIPFNIEEQGETVGRKSEISLEITANLARYTDQRSDSDLDLPEELELVNFEDDTVVFE